MIYLYKLELNLDLNEDDFDTILRLSSKIIIK